jgi:hypothetical protein
MSSQTNLFSEQIESACETATKRGMGISHVLQGRRLTTEELAAYLGLGPFQPASAATRRKLRW